jgi:hypothetical protein
MAQAKATIVVLLPHELAGLIRALRAHKAWAVAHNAAVQDGALTDADRDELWALMLAIVQDAHRAFRDAVDAPEPKNVFMTLGAPVLLADGEDE